MRKATVCCDEDGCGWEELCEREDVAQWHRKPCPKCGNGEIINDAELSILRIGLAFEALGQELYPDAPKTTIHVDTKRLFDMVKEANKP